MYNNIIADRRKKLGLTMKQVADALGVSEATVSRWESGYIANMRRDRISKLATILQISPLELLCGSPDEPLPANVIPFPSMKKVPLIGDIACGEPILAEENIVDYVNMPEEIPGTFALRCKGDSMINARIFDGDLVFVRQQPEVENGEIAAVLIDNEATLKRFFRYSDRVELRAENPTFRTLTFVGPEMARLRVIGKAVAFASYVR